MAVDEDLQTFGFVDALLAARSGLDSGFDYLFDRFARSVLLLGVFECHSDPERLVDEVLAASFSNVGEFVGSEPAFAGQLFSTAMDRIVHERVERGVEADEHVLCDQYNFTEVVESDRILDLHDSLHWLTGPERRALHLRVTFGLNLLQTARVLGISILEVRALQASIERSLSSNSVDLETEPTSDSTGNEQVETGSLDG